MALLLYIVIVHCYCTLLLYVKDLNINETVWMHQNIKPSWVISRYNHRQHMKPTINRNIRINLFVRIICSIQAKAIFKCFCTNSSFLRFKKKVKGILFAIIYCVNKLEFKLFCNILIYISDDYKVVIIKLWY